MVIVPSVDVAHGRASVGDRDPLDLARHWVELGARELHLVDLDAAHEGIPRNEAVLERIARSVGVPCRLAGGLSDIDRAQRALDHGFAGVLFSSAVFGDPGLVAGIRQLGDRATIEVESRAGRLAPRGGLPQLVAAARAQDAVAAACAAVTAGIGSLYLIDLEAEARLGGPSLALLGRVRAALDAAGLTARLHTGGGVRDLADLVALRDAGAVSVVVGRALAEGRIRLAEAQAACG